MPRKPPTPTDPPTALDIFGEPERPILVLTGDTPNPPPPAVVVTPAPRPAPKPTPKPKPKTPAKRRPAKRRPRRSLFSRRRNRRHTPLQATLEPLLALALGIAAVLLLAAIVPDLPHLLH